MAGPRVGLVGVGRWGRLIERTLRELLNVSVEVADSQGETEKLLAQAKAGALDGVLVATPGSTHAEVAVPFLRAGLPVFVEKPLALSTNEVEQMADAAEQGGGRVMVGHVHVYNPAYQAIKRLRSGLGRIRAIHFEGMNYGPFRDDMSAWWDWGPHDVSVAMDLLGSVPKEVSAWGVSALRPDTNLHDTVMARMMFSGTEGEMVPVTAHVSWLMPEKRKKMTVVGSESSVVFDDTVEDKVMRYEGAGPKVRDGIVVPSEHITGEAVSYDSQLPLTVEMQAFVEWVTTGKAVPTDLQHGADVVRVLERVAEVIS